MGITLLFGCAQIEMSVRDVRAAVMLMRTALGASLIEQDLARSIANLFPPNVGYDIEHLDCGEAMFQFNQPSPKMKYQGQSSVHQDYLDRVGPCVTDLNYYVDDAATAHGLLTAMGARTSLQGPSAAVQPLADYGPRNTRPGGDGRKFYFMGSRHLIGLDLELMEPNFQRFVEQTVQYPCFVHPRPTADDGGLRLLRLRLVVPDIDEIYGNLRRLFAPASISNAYDVRSSPAARVFRIGLGGIELEYCQPLSPRGWLALQLQRYGAGVVTVEFGALDLGLSLNRCQESSFLDVTDERDMVGLEVFSPQGRRRYHVGGRELLGFDVILEEWDDRLFAGKDVDAMAHD